MHARTVLAGACAGLLTLTLAACGGSGSSTSDATSPPAASRASASASAPALTLVDGWAKSTDSMPAGSMSMTGVFGTLTNATDKDIQVTGGMSPAGSMVETHETVKNASGTMQMQKDLDGFTVPAGGTFVLAPGANHLMVMGLTQELKVGSEVTLTLDTDSGPVEVTASVRAFPGAQESYVPTPSPSQ